MDLIESAQRYGDTCVNTTNAWISLANSVIALPIHEQLKHVNNFINQYTRYADDTTVWGVQDYWATPFEMFSKGAGDCEDYALAKYVTFRMLNYPEEYLRMINVTLDNGGAHMVLGYFGEDPNNPLIMDSMVESILPLSRRYDFKILYSFNTQNIWVNNIPQNVNPSEHISKWKDLYEKLCRDGITI